MTQVETTRKTAKGLFIFYLIALFIRRINVGGTGVRCVNLIPFKMSGNLTEVIFIGLLPAIPFGIFLRGLLKTQTVKKDIFYAFLYGSLIEGARYLFGTGLFDVTGCLLAVAGSGLGVWIYDLTKKKLCDETDHMLTMLASIACGVIVAVFLGQIIVAFTMGMEGAL